MARSEFGLQTDIVAPDGRQWHGRCSQVQIPAIDGSLGILPGRQPILVMLGEGDVIVDAEDGRHTFAMNGGFASVDSDYVTVVAQRDIVS
ncbi:MAG: hypothetical protein Q4C87_05395 [Actinomycetaceae bacterium]|nr:hypothetical protein [Actinomycetaceae bacterium]